MIKCLNRHFIIFTMITKQDLLDLYTNELAISQKVLRAVPEGQLDFRPHPRSISIRDLFGSFIGGMLLNLHFVEGSQPEDAMKRIPEFDYVAEAIGSFETKSQEFISALTAASPQDIDRPFSVWGMDSTRSKMIMLMLNDLIHHRGQLSVYIRLAGGSVPSIYGPSADDKGGF